ncbi:type I glyceraldehyde-3-phosphate dehydrogenase [Candidatus Micrarchaeota archaeon]|nr:type I glyceraldehyde-3-phosphate dehydrogenase [Candidatus Micrarchaeota archaeon]MBD3417678.1 type I glyceraldehyde-3-phosphate dehydrogenase [Candidatus Micrarchaeota archaeon]
MKVGISGFGRIGRMFLRAAFEQGALGRDFDVAMINTRSDVATNAHLFKYDSAQGKFPGTVEAKEGALVVNGYEIKWTRETDPSQVPWGENGIDVVIESTGRFRSRADVQAHLDAGAKRVIISAPGKDCPMVVPGVNMESADKEEKVFSLASCTTNCLAPVMKVLNENFNVKRGFMTTTHAYTNDQRILDGSHKDLRRARAAAVSIIPTSTGAAKAIGKVIPELEGKMDGFSLRVPVVNGSITDITVEVEKPATKEEVNAKLKEAAEGPLKGILQYSEEPLVSVDIIGNPHSSVVDSEFTNVSGNMVKVVSWYDNEYGYSNRLIDFIKYMKSW